MIQDADIGMQNRLVAPSSNTIATKQDSASARSLSPSCVLKKRTLPTARVGGQARLNCAYRANLRHYPLHSEVLHV